MPTVTQPTQKPVDLEARSSFNKGLAVSISEVTARKVQAELPGEVSGDAVLFTLTVKNSSADVVDLNALVVNVLDADDVPAGRITTKPATAMAQAVGAGRSTKARYAYVVPKGERDPITIEVSLAAEDPVLVFRGRVR